MLVMFEPTYPPFIASLVFSNMHRTGHNWASSGSGSGYSVIRALPWTWSSRNKSDMCVTISMHHACLERALSYAKDLNGTWFDTVKDNRCRSYSTESVEFDFLWAGACSCLLIYPLSLRLSFLFKLLTHLHPTPGWAGWASFTLHSAIAAATAAQFW